MSDPPPKRQRTARACIKCRQGKLKCDGAIPACSTCVTARRTCSYEASQKRRGLRGGYVRAMEALLGVVLYQVEGGENVLIGMLQERFEASYGHTWASTMVEDLAELWRQSRLVKEMERFIPKATDGELEPDMENEHHDHKPNMQSRTKYRLVPSHLAANVDAIGASTIDLPAMTATVPSIEWMLSASQQSTLLPEHSIASMDSYFLNTHSWFPIVERHHIYRTYYQYAKGQEGTESGHVSSLMAILASAEVRRGITTGSQDNRAVIAASKLLGSALEIIPRKAEELELGHVQGLLISSLVYLDLGRTADAWIAVSVAAEILLLGANSDTFKERKRLQHVVRGCQVLDCILATRLHLRPHSWHRVVASMAKVNEDGMEEWASSDGIYLSQGTQTGPMLALSTFNELSNAAVELVDCFAEASRLDDSSNGMMSDLCASVDVDVAGRSHEEAKPLTPQQLTLGLLRLASMIIRRQQDMERDHFCARLRDFCESWTANLDRYRPQAIPQVVEPLWGIVVDAVKGLRTTEDISILQAIRAALSTTADLSRLQSIREGVEQSLAVRQNEETDASMLALTPAISKSTRSNAFNLPAADIPVPRRMPIVTGLGIQDVDFSLLPELEDESEIPDQPLDQVMAQLRDTAVMPSASTTISPRVGSSFVYHSVDEDWFGDGCVDQLSW